MSRSAALLCDREAVDLRPGTPPRCNGGRRGHQSPLDRADTRRFASSTDGGSPPREWSCQSRPRLRQREHVDRRVPSASRIGDPAEASPQGVRGTGSCQVAAGTRPPIDRRRWARLTPVTPPAAAAPQRAKRRIGSWTYWCQLDRWLASAWRDLRYRRSPAAYLELSEASGVSQRRLGNSPTPA